jgi:hypothetical protein
MRTLPVVVVARGASKEGKSAGDPVPRDPFGLALWRGSGDRREPTVALGAPLEAELGRKFGERGPDSSPLVREVRALEEQRPCGPGRKASVSREDRPVLGASPVQDLVVREPPHVLGVTSDESEVAGQPADHFVR